MSSFGKVLTVSAIVWTAGLAYAESVVITAANGARLRAPNINHLTCAEMQVLLTEYADSAYRGTGVLAMDHPDRPIYEYEHRLAEVHYKDCQSGSAHFENSSPVFGQGFK